eukprot:4584823-Pleurochrysis_carterae.AAC.4
MSYVRECRVCRRSLSDGVGSTRVPPPRKIRRGAARCALALSVNTDDRATGRLRAAQRARASTSSGAGAARWNGREARSSNIMHHQHVVIFDGNLNLALTDTIASDGFSMCIFINVLLVTCLVRLMYPNST